MPRLKIEDLDIIAQRRNKDMSLKNGAGRVKITVHMGTCGISAGAKSIMAEVNRNVENSGASDILVTTSGCAGLCSREPMMTVELADRAPVKYIELDGQKVKKIFEDHVMQGSIVEEFALAVGSERTTQLTGQAEQSMAPVQAGEAAVPAMNEIGFFKKQRLIALRNRGLIDPDVIEEYIARGGYRALAKVLSEMKPVEVIEEMIASGLRGRGGGGFPAGVKWKSCREAPGRPKYVVCNADEGDPGAYMDRSIIEGDPHTVLEGMAIAAYAIGSSRGYVYIRHEYPLALERLEKAVADAREYGLLGKNIFGKGFDFDVTIHRGAGAFVCGESTALMASMEGRPGEPRAKYIHTVEHGLWDRPTSLNNVETFANVPPIILLGSVWFTSIGTGDVSENPWGGSKGTKVFSLVGKVRNTGLVEVPMGISLREIIFEIGGGISGDKKFKAVQTGGPSGGVIPEDLLDLPVDFDQLTKVGSMMGSGGMIVMDENDCMVDIARYFIDFLIGESCGKCLPCREGLTQIGVMLNDICEGRAQEGVLDLLEETCRMVASCSLCALGGSAPNPVLSTLKYFREEYEAHVRDKRCPAGVCKNLITYLIDADKCNGCTLCARNCPQNAITGESKKPHEIQSDLCIKCGICRDVCKQDAVLVR